MPKEFHQCLIFLPSPEEPVPLQNNILGHSDADTILRSVASNRGRNRRLYLVGNKHHVFDWIGTYTSEQNDIDLPSRTSCSSAPPTQRPLSSNLPFHRSVWKSVAASNIAMTPSKFEQLLEHIRFPTINTKYLTGWARLPFTHLLIYL